MTYTRVAVTQIPDWNQVPDLPRQMAETLRELGLRALSRMASKVLDPSSTPRNPNTL